MLKLVKPKARPEPVPDPNVDPDEKYFCPPPGKRSGPDIQTLVAIAVVGVLILAGIIWLNG